MGENENSGNGGESGNAPESVSINPFLAGNGTVSVIDPDSLGSAGASEAGNGGNSEPRKRRGRPPGSGKGAGKKANSQDISGIESILFSVHAMLAAITKTPELALDPSEANKLGAAIVGVQQHYDVLVDAKTMAWINLAMTAGAIYGTRIFAITARKGKEKEAKKSANVVYPSNWPNPNATA